MLHNRLFIRKVAVLGAGVMGAQIATHFVNVGITPILFDLPTEGNDQNALVKQSLKSLKELHPSPLALDSLFQLIEVANYGHDLALLRECDLVIEAISERLDWKQDLYRKITPYLNPQSVLVSNTSGLSINKLALSLPTSIRSRFCGVHFFNPPRYMTLVELIPHKETDKLLLEQLESFLVMELGKGVIYAKDTPNFIGNRVGVFSFLCSLHHAMDLDLSFDLVDQITGPIMGRPRSATFRTLDIVGLDTFAQVVNTMEKWLPNDPWHSLFHIPAWFSTLINKGALGQKTRSGIYKKDAEGIQVFDIRERCYRTAQQKVDPEILEILKIPTVYEKFSKLRTSTIPEAKFLWASYRDLFHYCAYHLTAIADSPRDIDLAIRWGFGWQQGPFELWQNIGWKTVMAWIEEDIRANKTLSSEPLPEWSTILKEEGPYGKGTCYSPSKQTYISRSSLPVYKRQIFPDPLLGEIFDEGKTIFETDAVRLWTTGDELAILSFKSKKNTISDAVLDGLLEAIWVAESDYKALILWQRHGTDFSYGANLKDVLTALSAGRIELLEKVVVKFQKTALALRYARVPTLMAIQGLVLGGACELMMHCTKTIAALESYPGLVEMGVGLIPAGAGSKEMALRASRASQNVNGGDPFSHLQKYFRTIARAEVAKSALAAKQLGFLQEGDIIITNPYEVLFVAKKQALALAESNYHPPLKGNITVAGKPGLATIQVELVNMREGGFVSDHDYLIGSLLARVMCGGEVEGGIEVSEEWLLELEQQAFLELLNTKKTQERIAYMLQHNKPLKN